MRKTLLVSNSPPPTRYGETIRKEMAVGGWAEVKSVSNGKKGKGKRGYMVADEEDRFSDQAPLPGLRSPCERSQEHVGKSIFFCGCFRWF